MKYHSEKKCNLHAYKIAVIAKLKYSFMMQRLGKRLYCCLMFYSL
jgi:hypothetical protein